MRVALVFLMFFCATPLLQAQELVQDEQRLLRAEVVAVTSEVTEVIPGTTQSATHQTLRVRLLEGSGEGTIVEVQNDYVPFSEGDTLYVLHTIDGISGDERYAVSEPYRIPTLAFFTALFIGVVLLFGGWQGARGLLALVGSIFVIGWLLLPGILAGYPPVLLTFGVASLIIVVGSYITHGLNKTTSAAVLGMVGTIGITGALTHFAIQSARFSGYASEEAVYLNFGTATPIDLQGLLLSGILIGLLGVLYDAGIGQAVAVEELYRAGKDFSRRHVFLRALRIGREHIGALVNTLAIAYVGAALPLLLLAYLTPAQDVLVTLNQEIFAVEILRTMLGSIGLVLAVPATTLLAVWMLEPKKD